MSAPSKVVQASLDMISFLNSDNSTPANAPEMYCEMDDCVGNASLRCPACKLAMCMSCHSAHAHPTEVKDAVDVGKKAGVNTTSATTTTTNVTTATTAKASVASPSGARKDAKKTGGKASPTAEEKKPRSVFEPYWDLARVESDLQAGRLKKGTIEIVESKKDLATFHASDGTVLRITGWEHRNRSLDGDTVAVQFQPNDESKVVYNYTPFTNREFTGKLSLNVDLTGQMVPFSCSEIRFPPFLITLPPSCVQLLKEHMVRPTFKLKATIWEPTSKWPLGEAASEEELEKAIREKSRQEKVKAGMLAGKLPLAAAGSTPLRKTYKPHVTEEEMKAGMESGEFVEGILRIVSPRDAFVTVKGLNVDVYLEGRKARNRAYDGDKVVIRIGPKSEWKIITEEKRLPPFRRGTPDGEEGRFDFPEEFHPARPFTSEGAPLPQPTGSVVYILHRPIDPVKVGFLDVSTAPDKVALFKPLDLKAPFAVLPKRDWPKEFQNVAAGPAKHFYVARFNQWKAEDPQPLCSLVGASIGHPGTPEAETRVMLTECNINYDQSGEFSPEVLAEAQQLLSINLTHLNLPDRVDFRNKKLFTIDVTDTNDVESGFTLEPNANDNTILVGVHAVDVSWFVKPDSKIDQEARFRGCAVSLVQKNLPMLPRAVAENLCSLSPGKDRLAFSVMFRLTKDGKLVPGDKPKFLRSIVRSCCKLDHKTAQLIIDHSPETEEGLPEELKEPLLGVMRPEGGRVMDLVRDVLLLHDLGIARRKNRFAAEGALSLKHIRLKFQLDAQNQPVGFEPHVHTPSHNAVEELKLLANRFVAEQLLAKAHDTALLLRQGPPDKARLDKVVHILQSMGVGLQTSTAGLLQQSLNHFSNSHYRGSNVKIALEKLCLTPMQKAQYFCPGQLALDKVSIELHQKTFAQILNDVSIPSSPTAAARASSTASTSSSASSPRASSSSSSADETPSLPESAIQEIKAAASSFFTPVATDGKSDHEDSRHWSKNLSAYTHFTSPLRRYADLEVQRLLAWTLGDPSQPLPHDVKGASEIADHCNFRFDWAKKAQELSARIYLSIYLHHKHPQGWEEKGMIVEVASRSFKVLVFRLGLEHRIQLHEVECQSVKITDDKILQITHLDGTLEARQVFDEVQMLLYGSIEPPCQVQFRVKPRQPVDALNPRGGPVAPLPLGNPFTPRPVMLPSGSSSSNSAGGIFARPLMLPSGGSSSNSMGNVLNNFGSPRNFSPRNMPNLPAGFPGVISPRVPSNRPRGMPVPPALVTDHHDDHKGAPRSQKHVEGRGSYSNVEGRGSHNEGRGSQGDGRGSQNRGDKPVNTKTPKSEARTIGSPKGEEIKGARATIGSPKGDLASPGGKGKAKTPLAAGGNARGVNLSSPTNNTTNVSQKNAAGTTQPQQNKQPSPRVKAAVTSTTPRGSNSGNNTNAQVAAGDKNKAAPSLASPQGGKDKAKKGGKDSKTPTNKTSSGSTPRASESDRGNQEPTLVTTLKPEKVTRQLSATSAVFSPSATSHVTSATNSASSQQPVSTGASLPPLSTSTAQVPASKAVTPKVAGTTPKAAATPKAEKGEKPEKTEKEKEDKAAKKAAKAAKKAAEKSEKGEKVENSETTEKEKEDKAAKAAEKSEKGDKAENSEMTEKEKEDKAAKKAAKAAEKGEKGDKEDKAAKKAEKAAKKAAKEQAKGTGLEVNGSVDEKATTLTTQGETVPPQEILTSAIQTSSASVQNVQTSTGAKPEEKVVDKATSASVVAETPKTAAKKAAKAAAKQKEKGSTQENPTEPSTLDASVTSTSPATAEKPAELVTVLKPHLVKSVESVPVKPAEQSVVVKSVEPLTTSTTTGQTPLDKTAERPLTGKAAKTAAAKKTAGELATTPKVAAEPRIEQVAAPEISKSVEIAEAEIKNQKTSTERTTKEQGELAAEKPTLETAAVAPEQSAHAPGLTITSTDLPAETVPAAPLTKTAKKKAAKAARAAADAKNAAMAGEKVATPTATTPAAGK